MLLNVILLLATATGNVLAEQKKLCFTPPCMVNEVCHRRLPPGTDFVPMIRRWEWLQVDEDARGFKGTPKEAGSYDIDLILVESPCRLSLIVVNGTSKMTSFLRMKHASKDIVTSNPFTFPESLFQLEAKPSDEFINQEKEWRKYKDWSKDLVHDTETHPPTSRASSPFADMESIGEPGLNDFRRKVRPGEIFKLKLPENGVFYRLGKVSADLSVVIDKYFAFGFVSILSSTNMSFEVLSGETRYEYIVQVLPFEGKYLSACAELMKHQFVTEVQVQVDTRFKHRYFKQMVKQIYDVSQNCTRLILFASDTYIKWRCGDYLLEDFCSIADDRVIDYAKFNTNRVATRLENHCPSRWKDHLIKAAVVSLVLLVYLYLKDTKRSETSPKYQTFESSEKIGNISKEHFEIISEIPR